LFSRSAFCPLPAGITNHLFDGTNVIGPFLLEVLAVQLLEVLGQGNFQGSWLVLAKLPNFLGFNPSSRAIGMWASERWKRLRAYDPR
jgi:hypothetical protein